MKGVNINITVNGEAFPCRPTMGAMLHFKRETGREANDITGDSVSDICTFMWCCVKSASAHDGKDFNLTLQEFADSIDMATVQSWIAMQGDGQQGQPEEDEKKS